MNEEQRTLLANYFIDLARHVRRNTVGDFIQRLHSEDNIQRQRRIDIVRDDDVIFSLDFIFNPPLLETKEEENTGV